MAVLMFWNIGRRDNTAAIGRLCREYEVDILLLAEAETAPAALAADINRAAGLTRMLWELPRRGSRIRAFTRYDPGLLLPAFDDPHVKMLHLRPLIGVPLLIVSAHLPSKLRADDEDQSYRIRQLRQDIEDQEKRSGHQNTVVIGDLNVNPFEDALTAADGLHGVMDESFWVISDVANVKTPLSILREQASALTEQTKGTLVGVVETKSDGGRMEDRLEISVPSLNDYRYRILTYEHTIELYPGTVLANLNHSVSNENEFIELVRQILSSDRTRNVLTSLLSQAVAA